MCNRLERIHSRQGNGQEGTEWIGVEKELMNGRAAGGTTEARKEARRGPRAANLIGALRRTEEPLETRAKARAKARASVKPETATTAESKDIGVNCPYKWTNSIDEEKDQGSSWESVSLKEKRQKSSRACRHLVTRESGVGPEGTESPDGGKRMDPRPAFHYLAEDDEEEQASGRLSHLVSRNAAGARWQWEESHRCS